MQGVALLPLSFCSSGSLFTWGVSVFFMPSSTMLDSMEALAKQAGAGAVVTSYLQARGILSVGTLAMLAKDDESFERDIIQPLLNGYDTGSGVLELSAAEKPIARAVLLYMFSLAKESRQMSSISGPLSSVTGSVPPA